MSDICSVHYKHLPTTSTAVYCWWEEIASAEGATQGDPLAMVFYAISTLPLIVSLQAASTAKQCWFANDASEVGPVTQIKDWWDALTVLGPNLGYFLKSAGSLLSLKKKKV